MSDFKEMLQAHTNNLHHHPKPSSSSLAAESLFSIGPTSGTNNGNGMNFASNFFSTSSFPDGGGGGDFRSFSHLLASGGGGLSLLAEERDNGGGGGGGGSGFKQNRPDNLVLPVTVSPTFAVSPGFSPSAFFNSPTFFSSSLSPFGMSCQQTLAQAAATSQQAPLSQPYLGIQAEFHPSSTTTTTHPLSSSLTFQSTTFAMPSSRQLEPSNAPKRPQTSFPIAVDKPADDGYNWRKYGQKQVKGSEYPRSYYKCTNPNCPVKKKVERSFEGHITEIIYKGQHNHERPQTGRRGGRDNNSNSLQVDQGRAGNFHWSGGIGRDHDSAQATSMQLHGPSDSEESGENYQLEDDENEYDDDDEPRAAKIRNTGAGLSDVPYTHKTMTEPKIVVQTRSEVDLLDDGYRWRKYGQKVVKGNPNPRSYYKCTTVGCKVRKHVERASTDRRAVVTTYEGKHNHDVPAARGSSNLNATSNVEAQQTTRLQRSAAGHMIFGSKEQRSIALTLKEEQVAL